MRYVQSAVLTAISLSYLNLTSLLCVMQGLEVGQGCSFYFIGDNTSEEEIKLGLLG